MTISNPGKRNALTPHGFELLAEALNGVAADRDIRVLALRGEGGAFSAGAELSALLDYIGDDDTGYVLRSLFDKVINVALGLIRDMPMPVVSIIDGSVAGGGVGIALSADFIIASRRSSIHIPFGPNLAILPDCGAGWLLPRLLGRTRAMALSWLDGKISAQEALDLGLLSRVVDDEAIGATADALLAKLASAPTEAIVATRKAFDRHLEVGFDDGLQIERDANCYLTTQADFREGVAAFLEKRATRFGGGRRSQMPGRLGRS